MENAAWQRASKQKPCPVCGGSDNCTSSIVGKAVWCGRVQEGSKMQNAGGQFLHFLSDRKLDHHSTPPIQSDSGRSVGKSQQDEDERIRKFNAIMSEGAQHPEIDFRLIDLAMNWGVGVSALREMYIGFSGYSSDGHWVIAEQDGRGRVIGVLRRDLSGRKTMYPGSQRGLILADMWPLYDGTIYIVEGASDVAALLSQGLCVVGRPSSAGGVKHLKELLFLAELPAKREVVVIGENDRKAHKLLKPSVQARHKPTCTGCSVCWPGSYGAISVAKQLTQALQRRIHVAFPPEGSKDVRDLMLSPEWKS